MKRRHLVTNLLSNVVAGIIVLLLSPALAVAFGALGLRPVDDLEGRSEPIPDQIDQGTLETLRPPPPPPPAPPPPFPPPPPEDPCTGHESPRECWLEELQNSRQAEVYADKQCQDDDGDRGVFDVVIFSDSYSWALGKANEIELNDVPASFRDLIETTSFAAYLEQAPIIYAVGTASCEGYESDKRGQVELARKRANVLKKTIQDERTAEHRATRTAKGICLGVFAEECDETADTRYQRRVILMALFDRKPELDEEDCIRNLFSVDEQLSYLATKYEPGFSDANVGLTCP